MEKNPIVIYDDVMKSTQGPLHPNRSSKEQLTKTTQRWIDTL